MKWEMVLIVFFLLTSVSASMHDYALDKSNQKLILNDKQCNSLQNKLYSNWLDGFILELKTDDENIYLRLNKNDCVWSFSVLDEKPEHIDMLVTGIWDEGTGNSISYNSFSNPKFKAKSLKGLFIGRVIKDYL